MRVAAILFITILSLYATNINILVQELSQIDKVVEVTKTNRFYQPHIVSVYLGKELEKAGVSNLEEALSLVPGVDIYGDNLGIKTPIFRGSNPLAYGQSKLFIDGVLVNDGMIDQYSHYLAMPIELIKRIEVIRGPGSKSEGVNIYAGSIYVTTYAENFGINESARIFGKYGSYNYKSFGFYKNFSFDNLHIYTEFYLQKDDKQISSGPDIFATGAMGEINKRLTTTAPAQLWLNNYSFALHFDYKDLYFKYRNNYYKSGNAFGISFIHPHKNDYLRLPSTIYEAGMKKQLSDDLQFFFKAGIKKDSFTSSSHVAPPGLVYPDPFHPGKYVIYAAGVKGYYKNKNESDYIDLKIHYKGFEKHSITTGYRNTLERTLEVKTITTDRTGMSDAMVDYSTIFPFAEPNAKRRSHIFYIDDTFAVSDALTLYFGMNYERILHKYHKLNPRFSAVWALDNEDVFKLKYSRSHRNPSWQEMFTINNTTRVGNPDLRPEEVNAYEASYIKKYSLDEYMQLTLFYLKNSKVINNINEEREFRNVSMNRLYGLEFEWKKMLSNTLKFYGNYSYVYGECGCHKELPNIANHLFKFYFLKQFTPNFSTTMLFCYIGKKKRFDFDSRDSLKSFSFLDLSFQYETAKDTSIMLALKNIFNTKGRYPAPPNTYVDDYPYTKGRTIMFTIKKGF
ncbi:iron complex outermembrane recepter protein [Nitratiruptor sp. YY08-26]|uniref:TonB-dependent receptor plug domain-containing protein n=1 Tax=unclassified Nitratiruptor TaxID=2624044 RepID=UPI00191605D7|nr:MULTISPECIES: TonB-dependent receptor [unclassified Nitratiruptor]BCD62031.1 iron complex outermembrane recepter protein [Nitratiruptor sp. YY08-13]BCD65967.1 iron complex outermembrane recepter protein [Nitratiruptor sp. YY08-26]